MKLEIDRREKEGILVLDLKGRLVLGDQDLALRHGLQSVSDERRNQVILNLQDVSDIDSTGMGTLVFWALRFRESGGKMVLLHLSDSQAKLPEILKLNAVFETYKAEVDAVNSFFPERKVAHYDILDFVEEQENRK